MFFGLYFNLFLSSREQGCASLVFIVAFHIDIKVARENRHVQMVLISEAIRYLASSPQIQGLVNNKGWNTTIVVTLILSILGIIINAGAAIFLRRKQRLFAR